MDGADHLGQSVTASPDSDARERRKRLARAARCFDASGRLVRWPSRRGDQILALWVLWSYLPADTRYDEAEINAMLGGWNAFSDYALLRRDLVDLGLLQRTPDGRIYRRANQTPPPEAAAFIAQIAGTDTATDA
jgi:hypothetical protein